MCVPEPMNLEQVVTEKGQVWSSIHPRKDKPNYMNYTAVLEVPEVGPGEPRGFFPDLYYTFYPFCFFIFFVNSRKSLVCGLNLLTIQLK